MEYRVRAMPAEQIMEPLLGLLEDTHAVPLIITGDSMTPFLVHERDTVYLSKVDGPLKKGDMVLYQRKNGAYVLHRIYRAEGDSYTMVGDAQTLLERGIRPEQIRARVSAVQRKGRLLKEGSFLWEFFGKIWIRMVPARPAVRRLGSALKRLLPGRP